MRIGILGGTFDPIHFGHIRPAQEVKQALNLDKVWLMPNHIPPHKTSTSVSTEQRLEMTQLVCDEYSEFELCAIEAKREAPSYLVTTLKQITNSHPNDEFFFIMGMDSLLSLDTWFEWQSLFGLCHIVVCQRPGWSLSPDSSIFSQYQSRVCSPNKITGKQPGLIIPIPVKPQAISSTHIREQLSQRITPTDTLPDKIIQYIEDKNLYRT
ncbi:nicotinate-nucleotide adenylyltransferase [Shewanella woodyi]|uniref:nicotinate-nucleotide adenylyltransferase n=1 Tax=Shewanella woodyi TaxID=60961 RepID=UPI003748D0B8